MKHNRAKVHLAHPQQLDCKSLLVCVAHYAVFGACGLAVVEQCQLLMVAGSGFSVSRAREAEADGE